MPFRKLLDLLLGLAIASGLSPLTSAGTIRHDPLPGSDTLDRRIQVHQWLAERYPSVGQIFYLDSQQQLWAASGTLIAPNWVLTSAHVVHDATALTYLIDGQWQLDPDNVYRWDGQSSLATELVPYPDWQPGPVLPFADYDIGLAQLSDPIQGVRPARRYRGKTELHTIGTAVGYGLTGTGETGYDPLMFPLWKLAGTNTIDAYLPTSEDDPRVFLSDFDKPGDGSESSMGRKRPRLLEYLIAPGDSGGGVFIGGVLAAVNSFAWGIRDGIPDSDYGDVSGHVRVSMYNDWIDDILGAEQEDDDGHGRGAPGGDSEELTAWLDNLLNGGLVAGDHPFAGNAARFVNLNAAPVPEPSTPCLLLSGALCLIGCWWRKRKR